MQRGCEIKQNGPFDHSKEKLAEYKIHGMFFKGGNQSSCLLAQVRVQYNQFLLSRLRCLIFLGSKHHT